MLGLLFPFCFQSFHRLSGNFYRTNNLAKISFEFAKCYDITTSAFFIGKKVVCSNKQNYQTEVAYDNSGQYSLER